MSEGFLGRWSRLKRSETADAKDAAKPEGMAAEPPLPAPLPEEAPPPADLPPPDLPPVEELSAGSDFTAFLKEGVPEELKRAALRKLWASDPLFSAAEALDLHMEDYSQPMVSEAVQTAWKFGKGMVEEAVEKLTEEARTPPPIGQVEDPASG